MNLLRLGSLLALVLFVLFLLVGCSTEATVRADWFYKKKNEPRTVMPWFGSVGGDSNRNGWFFSRKEFPALNDESE
jgi:hypothetical protein